MILESPSLHPALEQLLDEAHRFLALFHLETDQQEAFAQRWQEVEESICSRGTYEHTRAELEHGSRMAWRNSVRCVGRHYWNSLQLMDCRHVTEFEGVCDSICRYLVEATHGGHIRPTILVFPPVVPGRGPMRIWNEQLIRYAGYRRSDGSVLGDPRQLEITAVLRELGWEGGPGTPFDVLPLAIQVPDSAPRLFELPADTVLEVPLEHPELPAFAELGLKWHALPAISSMRLEVGGIHYTCAPFNGWYMGAEIGARNLSDVNRYNLLPAVARLMGLDTQHERSLWRDRALVELNVAVLHSFEQAGVKMVDHHTVSEHFLRFEEREARCSRDTQAEWTWVVPPISGSTSPLFQHPFENQELTPNFFYQEPPWRAERKPEGAVGKGCPFHTRADRASEAPTL
ncbi:MAG TPA: nitric oxide synthase oxygenase [Thermoanaerobaculia bacterium]|nr:nitric oxide synthase oxygenase [Thermoanaerobaculia bacterium]